MEAVAHLRNNPTSTRKMRLVADLIRGKKVYEALTILKYSKPEDSELVVKEIQVNAGTMLKRFLPAPQGRAYRLRKRSNHVTIKVDTKNAPAVSAVEETEEATA